MEEEEGSDDPISGLQSQKSKVSGEREAFHRWDYGFEPNVAPYNRSGWDIVCDRRMSFSYILLGSIILAKSIYIPNRIKRALLTILLLCSRKN